MATYSIGPFSFTKSTPSVAAQAAKLPEVSSTKSSSNKSSSKSSSSKKSTATIFDAAPGLSNFLTPASAFTPAPTYTDFNSMFGTSVLGANTSNPAPAPTPAPTGNNNNIFSAAPSTGIEGQAGALTSQTSDDWDTYIKSLTGQLSGLSGQKDSQSNIAESQFNQGVNTLDLQKGQGMQSLDTEAQKATDTQASNLRDLSGNIRNAFLAGNVYLGAKGAGDSSAANQYSYALNKMGTQQRSTIMQQTASALNDISARRTDLQNRYNTEVNNLQETKNQQIQQIITWFNDAQNQVKNMVSQGLLGKGQALEDISRTLLNQAIAQANNIQQAALAKMSTITTQFNDTNNTMQTMASGLQPQSPSFDYSTAKSTPLGMSNPSNSLFGTK